MTTTYATHATHDASQVTASVRRRGGSAGSPVLASKITAPAVPDWAVQRPRITKLIAEGTRWCPLTVVTGPPGAGKTMALALWTATGPGPVAWVSLDKYDNRPGVFWSYVATALRRSGVTVPKSLPTARGRAGNHEFLLRLAAAVIAHDPPVTLVLDDLHHLTDPMVLEGLDFLVRNVGSGLRLVVCSRMDPMLRLHRYRVAGQLAEIQADDLAFTIAEAGLLLAGHGCTLTADLLECLMRRTGGWAAGLRLAALSLASNSDPGQFVNDLIAQDSALIGYLVDEVLDAQPPQVRDVLLCTSILDQVSADAAAELAGDEQAREIFSQVARANAFIQPIGLGRYRYHELFAEVLRLTLQHECPDRVAALHRRAARWHERNGRLTDAVGHAARAGDWQLAAELVIDDLAIDQILTPHGNRPLAGEFASMPPGQTWTGPQPHLVAAAAALSAGQLESCAAALAAADAVLERVPADQQAACGLAVAMIRLAASLRNGDVAAAATAVASAGALLRKVPAHKLDRHPEIRARIPCGLGAVELWSGHLDEAARVLQAGMAAQVGSASEGKPADCLGHLALAEALRGRLRRAAKLAAQATAPPVGSPRPPARYLDPAALVALAWVHLERNELREAGVRLKQADAALNASPATLIAAVAYLAAARGALAEGHAAVATRIITRARSGCPVPAWVGQQLSLIQSRACATTGDLPAAIAAAEGAGAGTSPEVAVTLAHAWAAAGDGDNARRALEPALADHGAAADRVRVQAWLVDARLSYTSGDRARGRRSLASALRLAEPEQLRLPLVLERSWLWPVLRRDPDLASTHRCLLAPALLGEQLPTSAAAQDQAAITVVEPLSAREREVLRHLSGMLSTAEVANEMLISVFTVKTHLRSAYRKLAATNRGEAVRRARRLGLI